MKRQHFKYPGFVHRNAPPRGRFLKICLVLLFATVPCHAASADDETTIEQLRAALQQATAQIATLEGQNANLQASQAPEAAMIAALQAQIQTLKGGGPGAQTPAQKTAQDKALAALKHQLAVQAATLGKAQNAYAQAANAANANAAANARLTAQLTALRTQNDSCEVKNSALFQTGNLILDQLTRRDNFWSSLASREPFIGFERVQLQNIVQTDHNKLLDNQLPPPAGSGP